MSDTLFSRNKVVRIGYSPESVHQLERGMKNGRPTVGEIVMCEAWNADHRAYAILREGFNYEGWKKLTEGVNSGELNATIATGMMRFDLKKGCGVAHVFRKDYKEGETPDNFTRMTKPRCVYVDGVRVDYKEFENILPWYAQPKGGGLARMGGRNGMTLVYLTPFRFL